MKYLIISLNFILLISRLFAGMGEISGTVFDANTLQSLEGANITLDDSRYGTASDTTGKFYLKHIPTGNYVITVSYVGYKTVRKDVYISENRKTDLNIYLEPITIAGKSIILPLRVYS